MKNRIPKKLPPFIIKSALACLQAVAKLGRTIGRSIERTLPGLRHIGHFISKYLFLPIYSIVFVLRLRLTKLILSARGFFFLLFTNRYVFHAVLIVISITTIAGQLETKQATAKSVGGQSLLYTLVTRGQDDLVEETPTGQPFVKNANYLGSDTIKAVPAIDYDYDEESDLLADTTVPGSIALIPGADDMGIPGQKIVASRNDIETYTVQPGDTLASISASFGIDVGTVIWANNLKTRSIIRPGDTLKILPVSGVLHTVKKGENSNKIATIYKVNIDSILAANRLTSPEIGIGQQLIIPGAVPIEPPKPKPVATKKAAPSKNGSVRTDIPVSNIRNKSFDAYQEIATAQGDTRAKPADLVVEGTRSRLLWPTRLRVINQYYGWRHTGVDIDGDYTDPIYAADDGVVEIAGWNSGGYGLQIVVRHANGMKTRYAHASKLFVVVGEEVKRGQVMAMVGTTGRSTGTHLHFEVYVGSARKNPLAYTK